MKKLILIAFVFVSLFASAQEIKVKQVVGAVRPYRQNISVSGNSSFVPSWIWSKTNDTNIPYSDGKNLFYIHDTLFAIGGYNGALDPPTTDSIHYSTNFGASWSAYSVKWPYNHANVTSIKAKYPGDWNYIFGSTLGGGGDQRTVIRFKDLQHLFTMTITAEYGDRISFGSTQDEFGNLYIFGGQTAQDTTTTLNDVWMSTAQSGGAEWTQVQSSVSWLGGCLVNQVQERNGYIYVLKYGDKFAGGGGASAYSNKCAKIAVEDIRDKTKWKFIDAIPNVLGLFTSTAVYKGNIFIGLGNYLNINRNNLAYLDNDDKWHVLHNYVGVDSTEGLISETHASDFIVIGESLYGGVGSNSSALSRLHDTSFQAAHFVREYLGVRNSAYLSQPLGSYETILSNGVIGSSASGDSMIRVHSDDAPYMVQSKTDGTWWGRLTGSNSTQNSPVHISTGRKVWLDANDRFNVNTPALFTNETTVSNTGFFHVLGSTGDFYVDPTIDFFGYQDNVTAMTVGFKYHSGSKSFYLATNNTYGAIGFRSSATNPSQFGRSAVPNGSITSVDGIFPYNADADNYRLLGYRTNVPTSGEFAAGDMFLYNGSDATKIAYRCTVSGSPGTWITVTSGSGGSTTFAGLTDVSLTSPANNDIAVYNGTAWLNKTPAQIRTILGLSTVATTGAYSDLTGIPSTIMKTDQANAVGAGNKLTVTPSATTAGFNFSGISSDPSSLSEGDIWRNTTGHTLKFYDNSTTKTIATTSDIIPIGNVNGSIGTTPFHITGNPTNNGTLWATSTGSQNAIWAENTSTGPALTAINTNGGGQPLFLERDGTATNDIQTIMTTWRTGGTIANNFGSQYTNQLETSDGTIQDANFYRWYWTNATTANRTSNTDIYCVNNATTVVAMNIQPNGVIRVNNNADTLATKADVRDGVGVYKVSGSDVSNTSTTLATITGLVSGTLAVSTLYEVDILIDANSSSTAGSTYAIVLGGTGTGGFISLHLTATTSTTAATTQQLSTSGTASSAVMTLNGEGTVRICGYVKTNSSGTPTITVQQAKTTSGTIIARVGSRMKIKPA